MNAEQIKKIASDYLNDCEKEDDVLQVFDIAIKAVEQGDVLDKLQTEITELFDDRPPRYNHQQRIELYTKVLLKIKKYKEGA